MGNVPDASGRGTVVSGKALFELEEPSGLTPEPLRYCLILLGSREPREMIWQRGFWVTLGLACTVAVDKLAGLTGG